MLQNHAQFLTNWHSSTDFYSSCEVILGQKSCFLGPTIFEILQLNWYWYTFFFRLVIIASILINVPKFFEFKHRHNENGTLEYWTSDLNENANYVVFNSYYECAVIGIIPLLALCYLNYKIYVGIKRSTKNTMNKWVKIFEALMVDHNITNKTSFVRFLNVCSVLSWWTSRASGRKAMHAKVRTVAMN